jgi:prepilin-type N-terminal cleavage/methylation domain-containing protein
MTKMLRGSKGISLIELMVALVVSAILIAGLYRTFIGQQKTFTVQEQVVDMQQNARIGINRMMKEIRMGGFGTVGYILPSATFGSKMLNNVFNANNPTGGLTVITSVGEVTLTGIPATNKITVSSLKDGQNNDLFDTGNRKYISVGGVESCAITSIDTGTKTLTLNGTLKFSHVYGDPDPLKNAKVFPLRAISFQRPDTGPNANTLTRDENLGAGEEVLADNISALQFTYLDANGVAIGDPVANAANIRVVNVSVTARTGMSDPDYKTGSGYRTRTITSNIKVRNMGL